MEENKILEGVMYDPEKVSSMIEQDPYLPQNVDFSLQVTCNNKNYRSQYVLYQLLLLFMTHLPMNYLGTKPSSKELKDMVVFLLPKKAFREFVNLKIKSYRNNDILKVLIKLGQNKVVTIPGKVVNLFKITVVDDKNFDAYWCLSFDKTTIPYVCGPAISLMLVIQGIIPFTSTKLLTLSEMTEERKKAGLDIPPVMATVNANMNKIQ